MIIYLFLQSASSPTNDIILSRCDTSFNSGINFKYVGYIFFLLIKLLSIQQKSNHFLGCLEISILRTNLETAETHVVLRCLVYPGEFDGQVTKY